MAATFARVKICGINDPAAYDAAATADWVGFVFFPPSPRYVTPDQAASLAQPGGPAKVGLFVDPTDDAIRTTLDAVSLDVLQVVATSSRAAAIRHRFGRPVWRVVGVTGVADLPTAPDGVDGLLLDAKAPPDATIPGGNATVFDWTVLRGWTAPLPWLLAGGLTPGNVAAALAQTGAPAVDVSSGVERSRGVKDPALITAFIEAVRSAPGLRASPSP
jgi:phosphoribosylanthranilate isomerase